MNLFSRWFKKTGSYYSRFNRGAIVTLGIIVVGTLIAAKAGSKAMQSEWAKTKIIEFFSWLVAIMLQIPLAIANIFLGISLLFLSIVTHPSFISLSFTRLDNPVIAAGWTMTRDLANVGIVLALIFIGLATILQLEGYQAKKALPTLIVIALLINFTPVILGLVVDAANILMDFLLKDFINTTSGPFSQAFKGQYDVIWGMWERAGGSDKRVSFSPLGGTIALIAFACVGTVVFTLFAILFVMRYVAIWMAVILSPLAFLAYVLPVTKPLFKKWLNFFIQWCFIGVIAAFFLYLSKVLMGAAQQGLIIGRVPVGRGEIGGGVLNAFLPYIIIVGFLLMGFIATLSISAAGTRQVITGVSGTYKKYGKQLGRKTWEGTKNRTIRTAPARKAAGAIVEAAQKVPGLRYAIPKPLREMAETKPTIARYKKEIDFMSSENIIKASMPGKGRFRRLARAPWVKEKSTAGLLTVLNRGDANDFIKVNKTLYNADNATELFKDEDFRRDTAKLLKGAKSSGELNNALRADPRLARIAAEEGILKTKEGGKISPQEAIRKAINEARAQHIKDWDPAVFEDQEVTEAALGQFDRNRWLKVSDEVKGGQDAALKGIKNSYDKFIKERNPENLQEEYKKYIEEKNFGNARYFQALEDRRVQQTGWKAPWDIKEEKTKEEGEEATPPPPPGEALGVKGRKSKSATLGRKADGGRSVKGRGTSKDKPPKGRKK